MASQKEIDLVCEIQRLAIQVNMQGRYHAHTEYSGHVHAVYVYLRDAKTGEYITDFATCDRHVYLSTGYKLARGEVMADVLEDKVEQLEQLKSAMLEYLVSEVAQ